MYEIYQAPSMMQRLGAREDAAEPSWTFFALGCGAWMWLMNAHYSLYKIHKDSLWKLDLEHTWGWSVYRSVPKWLDPQMDSLKW